MLCIGANSPTQVTILLTDHASSVFLYSYSLFLMYFDKSSLSFNRVFTILLLFSAFSRHRDSQGWRWRLLFLKFTMEAPTTF